MNYNEYLVYSRLMGGGGADAAGWLTIAVFLVFCYVSLLKPEKVLSAGLFRYAIFSFVLSLMSPLIIGIFLQLMEVPARGGRLNSPSGELQWMAVIQNSLPPFLLAISIALLVSSIAPRTKLKTSVRRNEPKKHPLDD